jgi:aminoglycoside phosphotransferase (APT) family kinase protein
MRATGATNARKVERIQSLWSGYGEVVRFEISGGRMKSAVVKVVDARASGGHPKGWSGGRSHERKLRSYEVERCFYEHFAPKCDESCRVPAAYHLSGGEGRWFFVMEDLNEAGFPKRRQSLDEAEMGACLNWLAEFHARFVADKGSGLWEVGTYWHLATRPDELLAMKDQSLLRAARPLDDALNGARFQGLVHGDAKAANFCFSLPATEESCRVAAVDFQYVGRGVGVKDVAYFLSSCLDELQCQQQADAWLDFYLEALALALQKREGIPHAPVVDVDALLREWRKLYPLAWADFLRFLNGWAPAHGKIHGYSLEMARRAIASLG